MINCYSNWIGVDGRVEGIGIKNNDGNDKSGTYSPQQPHHHHNVVGFTSLYAYMI
jgi:hypothetical protein